MYGDLNEWIVCLTSLKEEKSLVLLIDQESMAIKDKRLVNLKQDASVQVYSRISELHKVQFYQGHCQPDTTKNCMILFKVLDFDSKENMNFEVVVDIDGKECWLGHFYIRNNERYRTESNTVMYTCGIWKKLLPTRYTSYMYLRDANPYSFNYMLPDFTFNLGLKYYRNPSDVKRSEKEYEELLLAEE